MIPFPSKLLAFVDCRIRFLECVFFDFRAEEGVLVGWFGALHVCTLFFEWCRDVIVSCVLTMENHSRL